MNIEFDVFIDDEKLYDQLTDEDHTYLKTIHDFISQRLKPLKSQIDNEESELLKRDPDLHAVSVIHLAKPVGKIYLKPYGYSDGLKQKISDCISLQDWQYIQEVANKLWFSRGN